MKWLVAVGFAAAVLGAATVAATPSTSVTAAEAGSSLPEQSVPRDDTVTVMTRTLDLGADINAALDLLPDPTAAADFLWAQVKHTDFTARALVLAQEAADDKPDVIGLQAKWLCTDSMFSTPIAVYDFTEQFIEATQAAGVPYVVASADGRAALNPGHKIGPLP